VLSSPTLCMEPMSNNDSTNFNFKTFVIHHINPKALIGYEQKEKRKCNKGTSI